MKLRRSDSFDKVLAAMELAKHRIELAHRQRVDSLMDQVLTWRHMYEDERRSHQETIRKLKAMDHVPSPPQHPRLPSG